MIKCQQSQALTSHFECFWSIVMVLRVSVGLKKVLGLLQITFVKGILHKVSDSST